MLKIVDTGILQLTSSLFPCSCNDPKVNSTEKIMREYSADETKMQEGQVSFPQKGTDTLILRQL